MEHSNIEELLNLRMREKTIIFVFKTYLRVVVKLGSTRNTLNFLLHVWVEDDSFFNLNAAQEKNIS